MRPLVSVITTLYNCERFVKESLDSISEQQSFDDFEWLIYSDSPTDSTWSIVEKYKFHCKNPVILMPSAVNLKIPRRRNQAISAARGKYIAIHDGDDISLPDRLAVEAEFLESHSDIFCVGSHALKIDHEGNQIESMDYPPETPRQNISHLYSKRRNPIIDPTSMFRREDFISMGGYTLRSEIYTVPDMDLWCRAILLGRQLANIQKPLIKYRVNPGGMTASKQAEMIQSHIAVWKHFCSEYRKKILSEFTRKLNNERKNATGLDH